MTARVERVLYSDRTLLSQYDDETREDQPGWADVAHEAIRAMNHITNSTGGQGIPAPVVYSVLGNLSGVAGMLPQLVDQLASGLGESLDAFNVYDNKRDPADSVAEAVEALAEAGVHAQRAAAALSRAQVAINSQGYNDAAGS